MGSRAWIVILGLGIGSVVILGIITKVAVESSPELQAMIRCRAALAQELGPTGVEDVSLRRSRERRGLTLKLTFPRARLGTQLEALDQTIAERLLEQFKGDAGGVLEIDYQSIASWGCAGATSVRQALVPLAPVRVRLADRQAASALDTRLQASNRGRLANHRRSERELIVEIELPPGFVGEATELAFGLEPEIRTTFGGNLYQQLLVKLQRASPTEASAVPPLPTPPSEVRFDRLGRELDARGKPTGRRAGSVRPGER